MKQHKRSKDRKIEIGRLVYMQAVKPPYLSLKLYRQWKGPLRVKGIANNFGKGNVYVL